MDPDVIKAEKALFEEDADSFFARAREAAKRADDLLYDTVEKPKHYMLFEDLGIEVRDVLEKLVDKCYNQGFASNSPLFISDYVQLMQYLMRFMDKNGPEDLKKARWYLDKLIETYEI